MRVAILAVMAVLFAAITGLCSPFVPLEWQSSVETGPFAGQKKHVGWIADQNADFVDDAFDAVPAGELVDTVIQLNACVSPEALEQVLGTYGKVAHIGVLVACAVVEDVQKSRLDDLAREPFVAAVEKAELFTSGVSVGKRVVRARESSIHPTENFEALPGAGEGSGIVIAIVDSGIDDHLHDALKGRRIGGYDATVEPKGMVTDPHDIAAHPHGTAVAGVAVGKDIGIGFVQLQGRSALAIGSSTYTEPPSAMTNEGMAPKASFLDVRVGKMVDGKYTIEYGWLLRALEWIYDDGRADIVNSSNWLKTAISKGKSTLDRYFDALVMNGYHVVTISGNGGWQMMPHGAASTMAITVANAEDHSTIARSDDTVHSTSNYGPRGDFKAANLTGGMLKPDLAAPGSGIYTAKNGTKDEYESVTGTSIAAPHVSGAIALLLEMHNDVPPESMKELLKQTAYKPTSFTPYSGIPNFDIKWGAGLLDVYAAAKALESQVADLTFPTVLDSNATHPDYPKVRRCLLKGGRASYDNDADILLKYDPPRVGGPKGNNEITVWIENQGEGIAKNIVVSVGVKEFGVGLQEFYDVGSEIIHELKPGKKTDVSFPWTPKEETHQCIQAVIAYPQDSDFANNVTQRNVNPIKVNSPAYSAFRVENPLSEPATIVLEIIPDSYGDELYDVVMDETVFDLRPEDCPVLNAISFLPKAPHPKGVTATFNIAGRAFSDSHPEGLELSGAVFKLTPAEPVLHVCENIYDKLVDIDPQGALISELAHSWEQSADGTSVTFWLREGVVCHDGAALRGEEILRSLSEPVELWPGIVRDPVIGTGGIDAAELIDDYTLRFQLSEPGTDLLGRLATVDGMIATGTLIGDYIGSGPFVVSELVAGQFAALNPFDAYWNGSPGVGELVFIEMPDEATRLAALETGDIDGAEMTDSNGFSTVSQFLPNHTICGSPDLFHVIAPWMTGFACYPDGILRFAEVGPIEQIRIGLPSL